MNTESPVKLIHCDRKLEIKSLKCLICSKQAKKDVTRNPKEQGIASFIKAVIIRKECDGFTIDEFKEYIDIDLKTWKGDISQIRRHPTCYPTFTSIHNLHFITSLGSSSESVKLVQHDTFEKRIAKSKI